MFEPIDTGYVRLYPDRAIVQRKTTGPLRDEHVTSVTMAIELIGMALRASTADVWEINMRGDIAADSSLADRSDPLGQRGPHVPTLVIELIQMKGWAPEFHVHYQQAYERLPSISDVVEAVKTRYTQWMIEGAAASA